MRDLKEESRRNFDGQAERFDKGIEGKHSRNSYPAIINELSALKPKTVLDLGCGTGALLERVLEAKYVERAYGLDLAEKMLAQAREKLKEKATLTQGDSENLPFEDNFFDAVYCNDSFHHYPHPKAVLTEVKRVLKSGGEFIVCDPYQQPGALRITNFILNLTKSGNVKLYSKKELCGLMSEQLSDVRWSKVGATSHMVCGVKKLPTEKTIAKLIRTS